MAGVASGESPAHGINHRTDSPACAPGSELIRQLVDMVSERLHFTAPRQFHGIDTSTSAASITPTRKPVHREPLRFSGQRQPAGTHSLISVESSSRVSALFCAFHLFCNRRRTAYCPAAGAANRAPGGCGGKVHFDAGSHPECSGSPGFHRSRRRGAGTPRLHLCGMHPTVSRQD